MRPLLVVALLAGCVGAAPDAPPAEAALAALVLGDAVRVDATTPAREPSVAELPDGTLLVAGYWGHSRWPETPPADAAGAAPTPRLWRSTDGGATWERLDLGLPVAGGMGNSDVSLAADAEGRAYAASLFFSPFAANAVVVGRSEDRGSTWAWTEPIEAGPFVDRPWVRAAPDGTVHVVWNNGRGTFHAASSDHGATFGASTTVHAESGDGGFDVGPRGELAVRLVPLRGNGGVPSGGADALAVSTDGGRTWATREIPGERAWASLLADPAPDGVPRAWDPVAFDGLGRLHVAWAVEQGLRLATSSDLGATWEERAIAAGLHGQPFFPYLDGGADGRVAATWFSLDPSGAVPAHVAVVEADGTTRSAVLAADTGSSDHGEYFEIALRRTGGAAVAVPVLDGMQALDFRAISG